MKKEVFADNPILSGLMVFGIEEEASHSIEDPLGLKVQSTPPPLS